MATTPNYSWVTPAPTDLVVDLPADFETFADAVDASVKALNPGTTAGDLDYYTSSTAKARLGIGTAGQVLTVNSGATAPEWSTLSASGASWTLLNTGGTSMSSNSKVQVSGISGINQIFIIVKDASGSNAGATMNFRINDSTSNMLTNAGTFLTQGSTYSANNLSSGGGITFAKMSTNTSSVITGIVKISGANTANPKPFEAYGSGSPSGGNSQIAYWVGGVNTTSSTVSSVEIEISAGTFDDGTLFVYGSAV